MRAGDSLAVEPADSRRWVVLGVLCLALLIVGVDGTIVNVALPTLVRDLGATNSQLQWIVDAYTIVFASFLLIAGNTGDRLGRKWTLIVGLVIFGLGSLGCSRVDSANALIILRGVQGLGAAFIMPATLSILTNVFPADERPKAIAIWTATAGVGVALGPITGGLLLQQFYWGSIFLVNLPIVAIGLAAGLFLIPDSRDPRAPRLDWVGAILSIVGLITLLFGIIEGRRELERPADRRLLRALGAAGGFVLWERHRSPILDVRFFANPASSGVDRQSRSCSSPCSAPCSSSASTCSSCWATARCSPARPSSLSPSRSWWPPRCRPSWSSSSARRRW